MVLHDFSGIEVGTKLRVRSDLNAHTFYAGVSANDVMARHRGEVVTVTSLKTRSDCPTVYVGTSEDMESTFGMSDGSIKWIWTPQMFECVVEPPLRVSLSDLLIRGTIKTIS